MPFNKAAPAKGHTRRSSRATNQAAPYAAPSTRLRARKVVNAPAPTTAPVTASVTATDASASLLPVPEPTSTEEPAVGPLVEPNTNVEKSKPSNHVLALRKLAEHGDLVLLSEKDWCDRCATQRKGQRAIMAKTQRTRFKEILCQTSQKATSAKCYQCTKLGKSCSFSPQGRHNANGYVELTPLEDS